MNCVIQTGRVVSGGAGASDGAQFSPGVNGLVLLDQRSTTQESRLFRVDENRSVILTAYGLSGEQLDNGPDEWQQCESVDVYRVLMNLGGMPQGTACGPCNGGSGPSIAEEVQSSTDCIQWSLLCGNPHAIIALPGVYRVKLSDPRMIGKVTVVLERTKPTPVPERVVFGGL